MTKIILMLFAKLFGDRQSTATQADRDNPATIQDGSENGMRRQLIQVLLRDVLRRHGIPTAWIDCQMLIVVSRTKGSGMYLRLVVQHWDGRLMNYAAVFQKELLAEIRRFEPDAANWLHGISWQLEVEGSCPYTTLPDKSFWLEPPIKKAELERLFAIRDWEMSAKSDYGLVAAGYEKTQPTPLQTQVESAARTG